FFFQAEDGIRDLIVTGVQTCALPISNITLLQGDILDLPFLAGAFDSIVSLFVMHHIKNAAAMLAGLDALRKSEAHPLLFTSLVQIGRASCRERVSLSGGARARHK